MTDIVIRVENLSKLYHIGASQMRHDTLRDQISDWGKRVFMRHSLPTANNSNDILWALNDVSFEIKRGEMVGMIGRNGAGKSTLLKILSRITEPTSGRVILSGRVGALLEVGTGFHPELTGRENIYLSGTILGMNRVEIDHKFDEIAAFAEIEKFLDTPVKHYSSGMYVRLGFAVAAHVNREIIFIDEVLAVGDTDFQTKCLRKMKELKNSGVTMILVSHNLDLIRLTCDRVFLLSAGRIVSDGNPDSVIAQYQILSQNSPKIRGEDSAILSSPVRIVSVRAIVPKQEGQVATGETLTVQIRYFAKQTVEHPDFSVSFYSQEGNLVMGFLTSYDELEVEQIYGEGSATIKFEYFGLMPGIYEMSVAILAEGSNAPYDWHHRAYDIVVSNGAHGRGIILIPHEWQLEGVGIISNRKVGAEAGLVSH